MRTFHKGPLGETALELTGKPGSRLNKTSAGNPPQESTYQLDEISVKICVWCCEIILRDKEHRAFSRVTVDGVREIYSVLMVDGARGCSLPLTVDFEYCGTR